MRRPDLEAARAEALAALGRGAERTLERLEAVGLAVVRLADLPASDAGRRTLTDVEIIIPEDWREPFALIVEAGSDVLELHALIAAVPAVREAVQLGRIMGHRVDVEIDEAEGLVMRAWTVEL
ncbi:hypothetical protein QOL99_00040 [Deinococcus sp. MIMF12]|uniref:Uncharacterized protein n=1 Tax=Deinococcus rhizophilus TaxID=3049544 RepID=A0ABT7JBV0_9DEIO|nr:hypothetical protein [Deinococcus rhizophilus]MDL2342537.1 hypothetical protein [Deinococcus rhizophilus]